MEKKSGEIIILNINGEDFPIDSRIKNLSKLIKEVSSLFPEAEKIPIKDDKISVELMKKVVKYCNIHNFNPPKLITPIKSDKLEENLCEKDFKFFKEEKFDIFKDEELKKLIEAAAFLQIQTLQDICFCIIATEFYVGDSQEDYEKIAKKHNVNSNLSVEDYLRIKNENFWIENNNNFKNENK